MRRSAGLLAVAALLGGCSYRLQTAPDCVAANLPNALQALPEVLALADPAPERLQAGFVLCSTHRDRLLAAVEALGSEGYSSYIGDARPGQCVRVVRTMDATASALESELSTMCRIGAATRIAYLRWGAEVEGKSVLLRGNRLTIDGRTHRLGQGNQRVK